MVLDALFVVPGYAGRSGVRTWKASECVVGDVGEGLG